MDSDAHRKVALVTGSARGIGRACVDAFLEASVTVVCCDRNEPDDPLTGDYHHRICDVSDPEQVAELVQWVSDTLGGLDSLVNNAGTHPVTRPIDDVPVEEFVGLLGVNLVSAFAACKAAMPLLRRRRGSIVNIASLVGLVGQEGAVEYCASKAAMMGLTKALAIDEGPHGVRVNAVCPGAVRTPLAEALNSPEQLDTIGQWAWMERLGTPREVGDVVAWLCSDQAAFVTGQDIVVAGGAELGYGLKGTTYYQAMGTG